MAGEIKRQGKTNKFRRFPEKGGGVNRPDTRDFRVAEALERKLTHSKLTIQERIDKLDLLLGSGIGAKRERARLQVLLDAERTKIQAKAVAADKAIPTKSQTDGKRRK